MELRAKSVLVLVLSVAFIAGSGSVINDDLEDRVEVLESKLEDVEERLGRQEDFVNEYRETIASFAENAGNSSAENNPSNSSAATASPTPAIVHSDFVATVLDVKREKRSTGYHFTLRYVPHAQNLRVAYVFDHVQSDHQIYSFLHELEGTPEGNGVMRVTIDRGFVPYHYCDHTYVYFMNETESVGIKVYMDPGITDTSYSRIEPGPLTVSSEELVYQVGEDTELWTVRYTNSSDSLYLEIVMVNLTSGEALLADSLEYSDLYDTTLSTEYSPVREKMIQGRLKTSRYPISGYVEVIASKYLYSDTSAVDLITVKKKIPLRPANQAGPFPDGYLGFAKIQVSSQDYNGTQIYSCNLTRSSTCREIAYVVSERAVQLTCREIMPNGHSHPLPVTPPSDLEFYTDVKKYLFTVQPTVERQNSSKVRCVARNNTGFQVMKQFEVFYYEQPQILVDKSSIQNGTNLTVTCVATGYPLARMTINVVEGHQYGGVTSYDVPMNSTTTSPDGREVTGVMTVPYNPELPLYSVFCAAVVGYKYIPRLETGFIQTEIAYAYGALFEQSE